MGRIDWLIAKMGKPFTLKWPKLRKLRTKRAPSHAFVLQISSYTLNKSFWRRIKTFQIDRGTQDYLLLYDPSLEQLSRDQVIYIVPWLFELVIAIEERGIAILRSEYIYIRYVLLFWNSTINKLFCD